MQTQVYISTKCSCIISSPYSNYLSLAGGDNNMQGSSILVTSGSCANSAKVTVCFS